VANVDEASLVGGNDWSAAVEALAARTGGQAIRLCAQVEAELSRLEPEERQHFLDELGLKEPGLDRLVHAAYRLLGLVTFFTAGPKETRAWTVRSGTNAPGAAAEIHSDFERHFIRAEVIAFEDFVSGRGEAGARALGRLRLEGRDYVVQDGDVIHFRVGV
jgi:ribosome-binding ATPase YchF (GTP1/OBG family)